MSVNEGDLLRQAEERLAEAERDRDRIHRLLKKATTAEDAWRARRAQRAQRAARQRLCRIADELVETRRQELLALQSMMQSAPASGAHRDRRRRLPTPVPRATQTL